MENFKQLFKYFSICIFIGLFIFTSSLYGKRRIYGTVTSSNGNRPIAGAYVVAYDSDVGSDQWMGSATTNSRGEYSISYRGGAWDGKKTNYHTQWRPDIYIKITAPEHHQYVSSKYNNWKLANDLRINARMNYKPGVRTIEGRVVDASNRPVSGARVTACDEDIGSDQNMGSTYTSSNGTYKITYRGGSWDGPKTNYHTQWRPDIYIVVTKNNYHKFKSQPYKDHVMANKLTVNAKLVDKAGNLFPANADMCNYDKYNAGICPKDRKFGTTGGWRGCKCPSGYYKHYLNSLKSEAICTRNPCGLGEILGCSTPLLKYFTPVGYDKTFRPACIRHDLCYRHGHATYGKTKTQCDEDFHSDMKKICNKKPWLTRGTCLVAAKAYYTAVDKAPSAKNAFRISKSTVCDYESLFKNYFVK